MNRCLRSLCCLVTLSALALPATDAAAKSNPKAQTAKPQTTKQQPAKQQPPKTQVAKKPHDAKKEPRPQRNAAAGKHRHAKHADVKKKSRQAKEEAPRKDSPPPLAGDLALVKEAIDLARKAKTDEATATRNRICLLYTSPSPRD